MATLGEVKVELTRGPASAALTERRTSIWPSIYPEILARILAHRTHDHLLQRPPRRPNASPPS